MFISAKDYNALINKVQRLESFIERMNKIILELDLECKHYQKLVGLYEACLKQGVKIDFPDVTGKGGKRCNNGTQNINQDNII